MFFVKVRIILHILLLHIKNKIQIVLKKYNLCYYLYLKLSYKKQKCFIRQTITNHDLFIKRK